MLITFFVAANTGGLSVSVSRLFKGLFIEYDETVAIILQLRFPRIIVAMLGGAIMAMSGVCMQAVMRNPLADPGIIGVSSGSGVCRRCSFVLLSVFGDVYSCIFFRGRHAGFYSRLFRSAWNKDVSPVRLILTGIAVDAFFTGLYQALNAFAGSTYTGASGKYYKRKYIFKNMG